MNIDIVYARNIDHPFPIIAWGIMIFQKMFPWDYNAFNHMAIRYCKQNGQVRYFDATGKYGTKDKSREEFEHIYRVIKFHRINIIANFISFNGFINKHSGKPYDRLQVFGLLIKNMLNFVTFNKIGHNQRKIVCSELIILLLIQFSKLKVKDTDNYDLLDTMKLVEERALHGGIPTINN